MTDQNQHWTKDSAEDLQVALSLDFVDQLTLPFEATGWSQSRLAEKLGLSKGRVSQMFNNPGNLTLKKMAKWTQPLGLNVSLVVYPEDEALAARGPISGEIFRRCWETLGKPADMWDLDERQKDLFGRPLRNAIEARPNTGWKLWMCETSQQSQPQLILVKGWPYEEEEYLTTCQEGENYEYGMAS